jgi:hypothetical protein
MEKQLFADPFGDGPRYRRVKAVLAVLDIGRTTLWRRVRAGDIQAKRVAGIIYIDMDSVRALFEAAPSIVPLRNRGVMSMADLGFEAEEPPPDFKISEADLLPRPPDDSGKPVDESGALPGGSFASTPANA